MRFAENKFQEIHLQLDQCHQNLSPSKFTLTEATIHIGELELSFGNESLKMAYTYTWLILPFEKFKMCLPLQLFNRYLQGCFRMSFGIISDYLIKLTRDIFIANSSI